jgi:iron(III) transport system substrate-binding protein
MRGITRRSALGSALAGLALTPTFPARANPLEEAARKEGTLTWYVAQVDTESAEAMGRAFTARYPGVRVNVVRTTGQVAYQRLLSDLKNSSPQCDVLSTTDISHMPALRERDALAQFTPQNAAALAPAFDGLSEAGFYYPTTATVFVLVYQTLKVKPENVPTNWTDLIDPKWKKQVSTGHPGFSGYTGVATLALKKLYGWSFFEQLAKNDPHIGRSALDPLTMLNAGERTLAMVALSATLRAAKRGNPVAPVYPRDGAVLCIGPSAVMAKAPHPNAARLFMEWLLSAEFGKLAVEAGTEPVRTDVDPPPGAKRFHEVKLLRLTTKEIGQGLPEVVEQWRDTFGN